MHFTSALPPTNMTSKANTGPENPTCKRGIQLMSRVTSSHSDYIAPISCVIIEIAIARPPPTPHHHPRPQPHSCARTLLSRFVAPFALQSAWPLAGPFWLKAPGPRRSPAADKTRMGTRFPEVHRLSFLRFFCVETQISGNS